MYRKYISILKVKTFTTEKLMRLLRSSRLIEEESPYKPEAFESRLKSNLSHIFAHNDLLTIKTLQRFLAAQMHTAS